MREAVKTKQTADQQKTAFDEAYAALNERQRQAVDAIEGPVMVLAGPGTGKTQVLAARVANILRQTQMDPWNILCLTFTESGVVAMRERLAQIMGPSAYQVRVHTFHSFCNDVIQEWPEKFSLQRQLSPLAEVEQIEILRGIIDGLPGNSPVKPFGDPYLYVSDLAQNIQRLKQEDILPETYQAHLAAIEKFLQMAAGPLEKFFKLAIGDRDEVTCRQLHKLLHAVSEQADLKPSWTAEIDRIFDPAFAKASAGKVLYSQARTKLKNDLKRWATSLARHLPRQQEMTKVYRAYQDKLRERGRYDYDDMIVSVVQRLRADADLLASYQEQLQYILVDEYQDTNSAQNETLKLLGSYWEAPNIFVVGDDKQSIFRFQGASLENLRFFYELYKEHATVIFLEENYRSQQTIIDAAQAVIAHNTERIGRYVPGADKSLKAASSRVRRNLTARVFELEEAEHLHIASEINQLLKAGTLPREIAILYRYNRDAFDILDALRRAAIPTRLEMGENVLADPIIRAWLRLLEFLTITPVTAQRVAQSNEALAEVLQYPWWGFEPVATLSLIRQAGEERQSLWRRLTADTQFAAFAHRLATWQAAQSQYTLQRWLDIVLDESGMLAWMLKQDNHIELITKLNRLLREVKQLTQSNPQLSAQEFLERVRLLQELNLGLTAPPWQVGREAVRLMTAHKAKGLEFEHVFLIHVADKQWGNARGRWRLPLPHGLLTYEGLSLSHLNEEDRRLFYVALTRAKEQVHLSYSRQNRAGRAQVASAFWHELPGELTSITEDNPSQPQQAQRVQVAVRRPQLVRDKQTEVEEWLRSVLKRYVMSVTHLNNYLECPRQFYYRNLLLLPAAKTKHMAFGTAIHAALHDFFQRYEESGRLPSQAMLIKQFAGYLGREPLTSQEHKDAEAVGKLALAGYYTQYKPFWRPEALLEYDFGKPGVVLGEAIHLTGKLDKVEILDAGTKEVRVVDYKTGNPDNAAQYLKADGAYRQQLVFYKLLTTLADRFEYTMVQGEIDFVQPSRRTGKFVKRQFEVSRADLTDLTQIIKRVWQEIQDLKFLEESAACGKCEYCQTF